MGRSRYKIFEHQPPYFLTCTIINWLPLFTKPAIVEIIFDSLKFLLANNRLDIYAYVVMENHLHLIAQSEHLSKEIANFKSFTARKIIDLLKQTNAHSILSQLKYHKRRHKHDRPHQFWQEGSHPKLIDSETMMFQKIDYIHQNPVRRGYILDPTHWLYSSARNYAQQSALLDIPLFSP